MADTLESLAAEGCTLDLCTPGFVRQWVRRSQTLLAVLRSSGVSGKGETLDAEIEDPCILNCDTIDIPIWVDRLKVLVALGAEADVSDEHSAVLSDMSESAKVLVEQYSKLVNYAACIPGIFNPGEHWGCPSIVENLTAEYVLFGNRLAEALKDGATVEGVVPDFAGDLRMLVEEYDGTIASLCITPQGCEDVIDAIRDAWLKVGRRMGELIAKGLVEPKEEPPPKEEPKEEPPPKEEPKEEPEKKAAGIGGLAPLLLLGLLLMGGK